MQNERDFKGVWIPKEIWLNKDLSITDRCILAEIESLDGENHCYATNEYFAEFFGISVPTVTRSISKLTDMGLIISKMEVTTTGRQRVISVTNAYKDMGSNQNDEMGVIKMINNYNNTNNTNTLSKDKVASTPSFEFGKTVIQNKKASNDEELENAYLLADNFTSDKILNSKLKELFRNKKDMCGKNRQHFYASTCKHYLDDLANVKDKLGAVNLSLQYNNTFKVMEPNKPTYTNPDTNKSPQIQSDPFYCTRDKNGKIISF